ncbi:MAG TPA: hypothetical protein VH475_14620 [Tepidisphaeraceae bacterium]
MTERGRLIFQSVRLDEPGGASDDAKPYEFGHQSAPASTVDERGDPAGVKTWAGFAWGEYPETFGHGMPATVQVIAVPLACLAVGLATPALLRVRAWRKRRVRGLAGHCPGCGYDLRATPDRCPECGTAPAAQTLA